MLSAADGQVATTADRPGAQGLIHGDVRVLSGLLLELDGQVPEHVSFCSDPAGTTFVGVVRQAATRAYGPDPRLRIDRRREVEAGKVSETITLASALSEPVEVAVVLSMRCDDAPMTAIRSGTPWVTPPVDFRPGASGLSWSCGALQVELAAPEAGVEVSGDGTGCQLQWSVRVPARDTATVGWEVRLVDPTAVLVPPNSAPLPVAELVDKLAGPGSDARLGPWLRQSLADLNSLRLAGPDNPGDAFFAAGCPWYLTLFGRDSLWTARLLLPADLGHAGSTLRVLARRQGRRVDVDSAEQPGKILHELRRGDVTFGDISLPPVYYGTVDATLLWICLLHDAWRAGLAENEVRDLMPACQAALDWLLSCADADHFTRYRDASGHGLSNQGWKDSADAVRFADGTIATGPVALVEVQGYAYEAARAGAALLDAFGLPGGDSYRAWAARLSGAFRASFWCGSGADRYPALALDGEQAPVDSLTSNIGHLLGTGLLDAEEELLVARRLASPELDSGLGLRTMSSAAGGYWPLSYHCGSVWPHDTAIAIAGLARAGLLPEAAGLVEGLLRAGMLFGGRLPELWSGEGRGVPYPAACRPQAWSAAAAVTVAAALRSMAYDVTP